MSPVPVSIATYNTYCALGGLIAFNGAAERAKRIGDALYSVMSHLQQLDAVCLQEVVYHRDDIIKSFVHHPHATQPMDASLFSRNTRLWPSGL